MARKRYNIKLEFPKRKVGPGIERYQPDYGLKALFPKKRTSTKRQAKKEQRQYVRSQRRAYKKKYPRKPIKRY